MGGWVFRHDDAQDHAVLPRAHHENTDVKMFPPRCLAGCALLLSALLSSTMHTQSVAPPRKVIGVALGGGSARGLAHVGVIRWFEEHRIPIDLIAGTSMGGLVGGAYA